jgi:hypothetical protein
MIVNSQSPFTQQEINNVFEPAAENVVAGLRGIVSMEAAANAPGGTSDRKDVVVIDLVAEKSGVRFGLRPEVMIKQATKGIDNLEGRISKFSPKQRQQFDCILELASKKIATGNSAFLINIIKVIEPNTKGDVTQSTLARAFAFGQLLAMYKKK